MAKTFDNISEAAATNYLFLFAQRTLALQSEPPTPPPLNVLGLPCEAILALGKFLQFLWNTLKGMALGKSKRAAAETVTEDTEAKLVTVKATAGKAACALAEASEVAEEAAKKKKAAEKEPAADMAMVDLEVGEKGATADEAAAEEDVAAELAAADTKLKDKVAEEAAETAVAEKEPADSEVGEIQIQAPTYKLAAEEKPAKEEVAAELAAADTKFEDKVTEEKPDASSGASGSTAATTAAELRTKGFILGNTSLLSPASQRISRLSRSLSMRQSAAPVAAPAAAAATAPDEPFLASTRCHSLPPAATRRQSLQLAATRKRSLPRLGERNVPLHDSSEEARQEEKQAAKELKGSFAEQITPLAEKITQYILDHQDDMAQEERWRTTMKRDTAKSFRRVEAEAQSRFDRQQKAMQAIDSKLSELFDHLTKQN